MERATVSNNVNRFRKVEKFKGEEKRILVHSENAIMEDELGNGIPSEEGRRYRRSQFHLVDLKNDKIDRDYLPSLLQFVISSSMVALDNFVYMFGSLKSTIVESAVFKLLQSQSPESGRKVFLGSSRLDLGFDPSQGRVWSSAPAPILSRTFPRCTTSLFDKIYAFGTLYLTPEVLDPIVGHWKPLNPVAPELVGCTLSHCPIPDPSNHRILLPLSGGQLSSPSLYAFSPPADDAGTHSSGGTWKCLASDFHDWTPVATVVEDVIYFQSHKFHSVLRAFDLVSGTWLKVSWASNFEKNVDMNNLRMEFDELFPLRDGVLCLATWSPIYALKDKPHTETTIYFNKFKVKRSGATVSLNPISAHSYVLLATTEVHNFLL